MSCLSATPIVLLPHVCLLALRHFPREDLAPVHPPPPEGTESAELSGNRFLGAGTDFDFAREGGGGFEPRPPPPPIGGQRQRPRHLFGPLLIWRANPRFLRGPFPVEDMDQLLSSWGYGLALVRIPTRRNRCFHVGHQRVFEGGLASKSCSCLQISPCPSVPLVAYGVLTCGIPSMCRMFTR